MKIGIVADDLTGAADSVAPFAKRGLTARVRFGVGNTCDDTTLADADVIALTAGTRDITGIRDTLRRSRVRALTRQVRNAGVSLLYKKIDSVLRGHLSVELEGMRREVSERIALVCPAFPANGRTVRGGMLYVREIPWGRTEFARPDLHEDASVREAFGLEGEAAILDLAVVRQGADALERECERLAAAGAPVLFADAETHDDLLTLSDVVLRRPERFLPVGSAGWTSALAERLPSRTPPDLRPLWNDLHTKTVLVVVGSCHPQSRRQARHLAVQTGLEPVVIWRSRDKRLVAEQEAVRRHSAGERVVMLTTPDRRAARPYQPEAMRGAVQVLRNAEKQGNGTPIGAMAFSGGETALFALSGICGGGLDVLGEAEPGVVLARSRGGCTCAGVAPDGMTVLLKSGSFGDDATLSRCLGLLAESGPGVTGFTSAVAAS